MKKTTLQTLAALWIALLLLGLAAAFWTGQGARAEDSTPPWPAREQSAARLLTQASFGPTPEEVTRVAQMGEAAWIDEQLALPAGPSHVQRGIDETKRLHGKYQFLHSFWQQALTGQDQLRQRVAFALSQIFVVSAADACGANHGHGIASYHDMLTRQAFGSYRDLLQAVTLHPVMGCYLSHLRNRAEDRRTGRVPDENYAREVMQLFSIGLVELNPDGTPKRDAAGQPLETYTAADVSGLAKVFTGWSWDCPQYPSDNCFQYRGTAPVTSGTDPWVLPMVPYEQFHSTAEKRFLGKVIPSRWIPDAQADLDTAMDTLSSHPNVGPFIGKQLIQRLVTSNPSPAYVARVSQAFTASSGSLKAMVRAILLDPEARNMAGMSQAGQGKVREPVLRLSALLRAFHARSTTGGYLIGNTSQAAGELNQAPYFASSVFNFYRPGYTPPGSQTAAEGLVSPEMQITTETSMAGYANFMRDVIWAGIGEHVAQTRAGMHPADVKLEFQTDDRSPILALADQPGELATMIDRRLMYGTMSPLLRQEIIRTMDSIDYRTPGAPTPDQMLVTARHRVWSALLLAMVSTDFLIQR